MEGPRETTLKVSFSMTDVLSDKDHLGAFLVEIPIDRINPIFQRNWTRPVKDIKDAETNGLLLVEVANLMVNYHREDSDVYDRLRLLGRLVAFKIPADIDTVVSVKRVVSPDMFFRL